MPDALSFAALASPSPGQVVYNRVSARQLEVMHLSEIEPLRFPSSGALRSTRPVALALFALAVWALPVIAQGGQTVSGAGVRPGSATAAAATRPDADASTHPPPTEAWQLVQPPQSSLVLARDGSLIGEIGRQWRSSVSIRTLPRYLPQAFIAVEDHRFYQHDGVDVVGIAGAIKDRLISGHGRGASTITQQLVGNMHPDLVNRSDKSLSRKLKEQSAAREMERHYAKDQILEAYLNQIHFGHGWYGVEAASRHYFGKPAARLSLAEAATLASLPKGPALYDPIRHPERARERRNLVLDLMVDQQMISAAEAATAKSQPVATAGDDGMSAPAAYLVDAVRQQALKDGVPVDNGGFHIETAIDPLLQRAATDALLAGTERVETRPGFKHPTLANHPKGSTDYLQGMVVAMDPATGDVLALVGGRDHTESPFNRATNAFRQPGSAFKPFVYASAIADSIPATAMVADTAIAIPLDNGTVYRPENSDGAFLGPLTLRDALAKSRNPVAVQLGQKIGMDSVIATARRAGIETPIAPYPSSAIGASAVRPIDLVAAYTVFDNLGSAVEPQFVKRIDDQNGQAVFTAPPVEPRPALDSGVAFIVRDMMRDVVDHGTATAVRRYLAPNVAVAGKTGTTNDNSDVWFVGMTPEVVAGVWLGFDTPKPIATGAAGGSLAAPIWGEMMSRWYASGHTAGDWGVVPSSLVTAVFDRKTNALADAGTPVDQRYTEYFLGGSEPLELRLHPERVFDVGEIDF
jgi:penicillin-binding protein 1A